MRQVLNFGMASALLFLNFISIGQPKETVKLETDLASNLVIKHYLNAPNKVPIKWTSFEENEQQYFKAFCESDNKELIFLYNYKGVCLEKWEILPNLPSSIKSFLDFEFVKYKVISYRRVSDLSTNEVYFATDINSRYRGFRQIKFHTSGEPYPDGISEFMVSN